MSIKLGCHVSMSGPDYLVGSLNEALSQDANCFMIYTGSPQSIQRSPIAKLNVEGFKEGLKKANINIEDVIVHAPYIMNLANDDPKKRNFALRFFSEEIKRVTAIGCKYVVLHPGSNPNKELAASYISSALNEINHWNKDVVVCLETMAGKGNEVGSNFEQLAQIIKLVENKKLIGVCLDTCHINDSGYDVKDIDTVLKEFDNVIGFNYLKVIHINDSLNIKGASKDRHANIGEGTIGLKTLQKWANHPKLDHICKILETPWTPDIYKKEIHMLRGDK